MSERPNNEIRQLGRCLKLTRQLHGRTQASLAKVLSISPQQIQKYELGQNRIPADAILRLALELKISVKSFFPSDIPGRLQDMQVCEDSIKMLTQFTTLDDKKKTLIKEMVTHLSTPADEI